MSYKKSFYAYIACVLVIAYVAVFFYPKWENQGTESSLGWDAATYYWYLPATFIYKDLKQQKFGDSIINKYQFTPSFIQSFVYNHGNRVITYSSGVAVVQLPAFAIAHFLAEPLGYDADGFSLPYQFAIQLWAICIGIAGLWFFRKFLLLFYSDAAVAVLLVMLVAGTCFLNYTAIDVTLTHCPLFAIYALLLLNTHYYYATLKRKYAVRIGLLIGMAILIRPSEIIAVLLPLFWGMENLSGATIIRQFKFLRSRLSDLVPAAFCTIIICSIQVVYWLYVTGQPLVYSYDDKTFSWLAPHTWQYLTSTTSGWLMYNPVVLLIFIGIPFFIKNGKNRVPVLLFFVLNLYVISAWDIWWYSGIGGRAMVQGYVVSLFIAGALIEWVLRTRVRMYIMAPFLLLFVYISIWVHYHAHSGNGLYNSVYMSKQYYWAVIGRWEMDREKLKLQDARDIYRGTLFNKELIYQDNFDTERSEVVAAGEGSLFVKGRTNSAIYPKIKNG
jgi:hypothetical protein